MGVSFIPAYTQNLITNGGFEEYFNCPSKHTKKPHTPLVPGWKSVGMGTPDYFNSCSYFASIPYNWAGKAIPHRGGEGMIGMIVYGGQNEQIETQFESPLTANEKYIISFDYLLASYSPYCIDRISVRFTYEDTIYQIDKIKEEALDKNTGLWEYFSDTLTANGFERGMMIGNFYSNIETRAFKIEYRKDLEPLMNGYAYYFIDNVELRPLNIHDWTDSLETDKIYTFKNLNFEFNSSEIHPESYQGLRELAEHLIMNGFSIYIAGHTDEIGEEEYNLHLSIDRAKAVHDFLITNGVEPDRIKYEGFGESKPLVITLQPEAKNRRVEFTILK